MNPSKMTVGKKVCWLGEVSNITPPDKETRDFSAVEAPSFIKALAILSDTPLADFITNMYFLMKKPPYPTKIFNDEIKARNRLKQFL